MSRRAQQPPAEESIYNLIPQATVAATRPSLYRSKHAPDTPPTASTFGPSAAATAAPLATNLSGERQLNATSHRHKLAGATFGPKNTIKPDPNAFQKANAQPALPQPSRFEYGSRTKPALDTRHSPDSPVQLARTQAAASSSTKNFISENALAVIMADARRPVRADVDYLKKAEYGQTPAYLSKVKAEISAEKEYIRRVLEAEAEDAARNQPKLQLLPEAERLQLLTQLKLKWEAVQRQYQATTHMVTLDTNGKVRRKEQYESELQQIEKSIEKLSKPNVFVQAF